MSQLLRRRRPRLHGLGDAVGRIAFAKSHVLVGVSTIVVEGGFPEHTAVRHHAGLNGANLARVTAGLAAGILSDAEIAWIDELDVFLAFLEPVSVRPHRMRRALPHAGHA